MNRIKRLLFSILSEQQYLRLLHRGFYALLDLGLLKGNRKFKFIREDGAQNEPGDYLFVHKTNESRFLERTK